MKKIIGNRITQARKANGLTIKVLAERTGLGAARIGNWEQGTRSPGPVRISVGVNGCFGFTRTVIPVLSERVFRFYSNGFIKLVGIIG